MPEAVQIKLLGGFEVCYGEQTIAHGAWRLRKAKTPEEVIEAIRAGQQVGSDLG